MNQTIIDQLSEILQARAIAARMEEPQDVRDAWDMAFGDAVEDRDDVHYDEFRWHIFSYGRLEAKCGDEARAAMDAKQSAQLHLFWENGDDGWDLRNAFDLTAADVLRIAEIAGKDLYLFDDQGCWTYVIPHAADLGPYCFQW